MWNKFSSCSFAELQTAGLLLLCYDSPELLFWKFFTVPSEGTQRFVHLLLQGPLKGLFVLVRSADPQPQLQFSKYSLQKTAFVEQPSSGCCIYFHLVWGLQCLVRDSAASFSKVRDNRRSWGFFYCFQIFQNILIRPTVYVVFPVANLFSGQL